MKPESLDLRNIANRTLAHYDERADDFWFGTMRFQTPADRFIARVASIN